MKAPFAFAYEWCTDFREDDNKITGSSTQRNILEKTKDRVIYTSRYREEGKNWMRASIVSLKPPYSWHLDAIGDQSNEVGDYLLSRIGPTETRLDMKFKVTYKAQKNIQTKAEWEKDASEFWDKLIARLEKDHNNSK